MAAADAGIDWPVIKETSAYSACYTTGTTGRPKGIYYSHRGIYLHTMAEVAALTTFRCPRTPRSGSPQGASSG